MGWKGSVADLVRKPFKDSPERKTAELQQSQLPGGALMGSDHLTLMGGLYSELAPMLQIEQDLMKRYIDYENMDDYPDTHRALNTYADESTASDFQRDMSMWVDTTDDYLKAVLVDLYHGRLRVDTDLWSNCRELCRYGNSYAEKIITDKGVIGLGFMPAPSVRRLLDVRGNTLGFAQDPTMRFSYQGEDFETLVKGGKLAGQRHQSYGGAMFFEPWEVVHWRLRMKHMHSIYGHSVLEPARWVWRRLAILEDAVLIYRLTRSPERYAFFVDVGNLPVSEASQYVEKTRARIKKKKFYNQQAGGIDLRHNPLSQSDDFWLPTRGGKDSTRIEPLSGLSYQSMDDINYFREKLQIATGIPAHHMGYGGEAVSKQLSHDDVNFAKTILRVQRELIQGYEDVGRTHLNVLQIDPRKTEWRLKMAVPTAIFELAQIEVLSAKAQIAREMQEVVSPEWIFENIFHFTADEGKKVMEQRKKHKLDDGETELELEKRRAKAFPQEPAPGDSAAQVAAESRLRRPLTRQEIEHIYTSGNKASEKKLNSRLDEIVQGQSKLSEQLRGSMRFMVELRESMRRNG